MFTCCFCDMKVLSLLFYRSSVFFLPEHNVMLSTADNTSSLCDGQLVCWKYNSFWWIWIYNCGCYVARLVRNSVCTLNQQIKNQAKWRHCEWRIGCDKRKKFTATLWQGNYSDNFRELILELIWKTNIIKSSRSLRWIKKYKGSRLEITRRNEKLFVFLLRRDCKIKKRTKNDDDALY